MLQRVFKLAQIQKGFQSNLVKTPIYGFLDTKDPSRGKTTSVNTTNNLPLKEFNEAPLLEVQEIQARILKVANQFEEINIRQFDFEQNFITLGLDSLNRIAFITSVEHEFNFVFPDKVFDNLESPTDIQQYIQRLGHVF